MISDSEIAEQKVVRECAAGSCKVITALAAADKCLELLQIRALLSGNTACKKFRSKLAKLGYDA